MKRYWIVLVVALVMLSGCASAAPSSKTMSDNGYAVGAPAMDMEVYAEPAMDMAGSDARSVYSSVEPAQQDRLVIKNAELTITADDPQATMDKLAYLADSLGGHVVSSNTYQTYANNGAQIPEGTITIRIPSEKLTDALERIKADAV